MKHSPYIPVGATGTVGKAILAAGRAASDPYLPEVTCQMIRLANIEEKRPTGAPCYRTPKNRAGGIGLRYAVAPLRHFVAYRERPWLLPLLVGAFIVIPFAMGYAYGQEK